MPKETLIDDRIFDVPMFSEVCTLCTNKHEGRKRTCMAFPQGIPLEIWNGENKHRTPYKGDMGITFTKRK